ncbi:MAG: aldehyde dehydrogenase family protein [Deltaproteobacteria bacterium]|nr:aldehyde dehydrogenase family protein [Deltaproteobacteria bacterium]MBW2665948.1 aldehyde dehydrogenase family protein [Deltaproteobacteria bacterium]
MPDHYPLLVPGAAAPGKPMEVDAPWDGRVIATVDTAGADVVDQALATAHALYRDRDAWIPQPERIGILQRAAAIMQERREQLATESAREGGKPLVDSLVEVDRAIDGVQGCIDALRGQAGHGIPMNLNAASAHRIAFTRHEPIGVVLAFSAFNHPVNLIVHQVFPGIAAGCPVIVKPAEATPLSCMRLVGILHEAGLPKEWCQALLTSDRDVSGKLVSDPRVAFFSFIGSGRVGWMLRSQLAPGARCSLEHGGAAPVLIAPDADLDDAIPLLTKGGFYHSGQVCVSVQRVFVHSSLTSSLAEGLAQSASALRVGDPTLSDVDVGPLIRPAEVTRIGEWVDEARVSGAEVLCGGEPISERAYQPTVLLNPGDDCKVSTAEIFGPVVCIYSYDDMDDAIARANALPYSFQAAVFTRAIETALRATSRLDAATVMVNDHTAFRVDWMPFAGLRESGHGIGGIPHTFRDMQVEKLTVIRSLEIS